MTQTQPLTQMQQPCLPDFYSVMVHEIGHIMGFSNVWDAWNNNLSGNNWIGANGKAAYSNQNVPMDAASKSHFGTQYITYWLCLPPLNEHHLT